MQESTVVIAATRRRRNAESQPSCEVRIDRADWMRFAPLRRRSMVRYSPWDDAEIVGALQAWADVHGRSPTWADWARSTAINPAATTLRYHFGSFDRALRKAGLEPEPPPPPRRVSWDDLDMIQALHDWTSKHGHPPAGVDWLKAAPEHPSTTTVRAHFGSWHAALTAAGLPDQPATDSRPRPWPDHQIIQALQSWTEQYGRPPAGVD
jgi:hypothetical protein